MVHYIYTLQQSVPYSYAAIANWKGIIRVNFILVFRFYIPLCLTILDKKDTMKQCRKIFTSQKSTIACLLQIALKHHRITRKPTLCGISIYFIAVYMQFSYIRSLLALHFCVCELNEMVSLSIIHVVLKCRVSALYRCTQTDLMQSGFCVILPLHC